MRVPRIAALFLALAVPLAAIAQPAATMQKVGLATPGAAGCKPSPRDESFFRGLRDLGYVTGGNVDVIRRCYNTALEFRAVLGEFVAQKVSAIVVGAPQPALAARDLTQEIPIICGSCGDPLDNGLVASLSRPGGNVTGFASLSAELIGKRVSLLKEAIPGVSRIVALINPDNPGTRPTLKALDEAGRILGLEILRLEFRAGGDFERVFRSAAAMKAGAVLLQDDPYVYAQRRKIANLALAMRMPASAGNNEIADEGLLISYGPNREDMYRRLAGYVDRVFKGAKAGDLPIEQPSKFDVIVNLRTAKAIGITIPTSVLLQATRVIK